MPVALLPWPPAMFLPEDSYSEHCQWIIVFLLPHLLLLPMLMYFGTVISEAVPFLLTFLYMQKYLHKTHTHTHTPACLPTSLTLPRSFKQKTQVIVQWKNSLKQSFDWKSSFVDWTIQKRSIDHRRQPTCYPFSIFHNLSIVRQYRSWQSQFLCLSFNLCFTLFPP